MPCSRLLHQTMSSRSHATPSGRRLCPAAGSGLMGDQSSSDLSRYTRLQQQTRDKLQAVALAACYGVVCQRPSFQEPSERLLTSFHAIAAPPVYHLAPLLFWARAGPNNNIRDPAVQWSRPIYGAHETFSSALRGEVVVTMAFGGLLDQGILRH